MIFLTYIVYGKSIYYTKQIDRSIVHFIEIVNNTIQSIYFNCQ